jgi:hypothetical protein
MTDLENLAHLKTLALAEDEKANGSFTMDCFWAWSNYNNALEASVMEYRRSLEKGVDTKPSL